MTEKMFCFQCQEANGNKGCTMGGMCGKKSDTANLQDLLIYSLKGISFWYNLGKKFKIDLYDEKVGLFVAKGLFATITNANFDNAYFIKKIKEALIIREDIKVNFDKGFRVRDNHSWLGAVPDCAKFKADTDDEINKKSESRDASILKTENEDVRSLRELTIYGLKGMAAYADHAHVLGKNDMNIFDFIMTSLAKTLDDTLTADELVALVLETGSKGVTAMALLDAANTETYGHPEMTEVNIGVRKNPGILISGHDLKDLEELLEQTKGTGVDVYTHSEMLPGQYYPSFKKYDNFAGNYGSAWWKQSTEFESFNGPILMTTNCITPPKETYKERIFTTGNSGFSGVKHIEDRKEGGHKDFSAIIALAKTCESPIEIETGKIVGGFARNQVMALADKVIDAVKTGAIKRFVVMAGCDGRHKERNYYTDVAKKLPEGTVILTAGCAKYRYIKLNLGDIGGIPRVLDAGQCNDSYSLVAIALALKEAFKLDDINDLPISYDIAWYEQKAVIVLLALLSLGVKGIRLGPTLPAFLSPGVVKVLVENFDIKPISDVDSDIEAMMAGK